MIAWLRGRLRTPDARWLIVVLALAFVVRLAAVGYVHPDPRDGRYDDSVWYDTAARNLADGHGYVFDPTVWRAPDGSRIYPDNDELSPTALWPPGYPATLAVVYAATGDSLWAARMLNIVLGAATAGLVYLIARRLFGRPAAIAAGVVIALLPSHVLFTSVILTETYYGFLLTGLLAAFIYLLLERERPHPLAALGIGALTAFTGYVRGEFMAYAAVLLLVLLVSKRRRALLPGAAFVAGMALIVTPWVVRNQVQMGEWIVGTTGVGRVLYQGHNPETDGGPSLIATWKLEAEFLDLSPKESELKTNSEGTKLAREWAFDHPLDELRLFPRRLYLLFRSDESGVTWVQSNKPWFGTEGADRLIRLSTAVFFGLIAVALAGAPRWFRWRDSRFWTLFALVPFYILTFSVLFIGDPRYHYALYFPIAIFAAPGIVAVWRVTAASFREVSGGRSFGQVLRTYGTPRP